MNRKKSISAKNVVVEYKTSEGTIRALECKDLYVQSTSSVAVMGSSGCGKSTLLGLLAGIAIPTHGSIRIGDVELSSLSEKQRTSFRRDNLGMVYQADNLLPFLTVEENIRLSLGISESNTKNTSNRLHDLLDQLGLSGLEKRLPDQMSGGQRQRVAIARAVFHEPKIILADEPTGALDELNAQKVINILSRLQHEIGATLVVVTHDPKIAKLLDTTIYIKSPERKIKEDLYV